MSVSKNYRKSDFRMKPFSFIVAAFSNFQAISTPFMIVIEDGSDIVVWNWLHSFRFTVHIRSALNTHWHVFKRWCNLHNVLQSVRRGSLWLYRHNQMTVDYPFHYHSPKQPDPFECVGIRKWNHIVKIFLQTEHQNVNVFFTIHGNSPTAADPPLWM